MTNNSALFLLVIGFAVCMGLGLLAIAAFGVFIVFIGKRVVAPMRQRQIQSIVEDWAEDEGYKLLDLADVASRDHPFAGRFGFGFGKVPGIVKEMEVRDRRGRTRRGWVFLGVRLGPRGSSSFIPESLEVAWDD